MICCDILLLVLPSLRLELGFLESLQDLLSLFELRDLLNERREVCLTPTNIAQKPLFELQRLCARLGLLRSMPPCGLLLRLADNVMSGVSSHEIHWSPFLILASLTQRASA